MSTKAGTPLASGTHLGQTPTDLVSRGAFRLLDMPKLSVPEAAKRLGIGQTSLRILIHRGEIPVIKIGRKLLLIESDLEAYLQRVRRRLHSPSKGKPPGYVDRLAPLPEHIRNSDLLNRKAG